MCIADKPGLLRKLAIFFAHSGDSWFWLLGLGMLWFFGEYYWKQRVLWLVPPIVITAIVIFITKRIFQRQRPEGEWGGFYRYTDPNSFPSGHAARAVLITVIITGVGPILLSTLLGLWALLVSIARVAMGVHYLSDVIAGGLIGMMIGISYLLIFV